MKNTIEATDFNFTNEVLNADTPVLVDFWAPWCGPCLASAPMVDQIAADLQGKLKVVKVNTDVNIAVADKYGIRSIPTFGIFKGGELVDKVVGALPKQQLLSRINPHLMVN
ncbi:MAG TPA: thioredoxin [Ignavibacteriales bacterium]|jgi:thioredoxin 1|nr:thioredoxin [Ignavibacteriales bacterium]